MGIVLTFDAYIDQCLLLDDQEHLVLFLKRHQDRSANLLTIKIIDGHIVSDAEGVSISIQSDELNLPIDKRTSHLLYQLQLVYQHKDIGLFSTFANTQWPHYEHLTAIDLMTLRPLWNAPEIRLGDVSGPNILIEPINTDRNEPPCWVDLKTCQPIPILAIQKSDSNDTSKTESEKGWIQFDTYQPQDLYYSSFGTILTQFGLSAPKGNCTYLELNDQIWMAYVDTADTFHYVLYDLIKGQIFLHQQQDLPGIQTGNLVVSVATNKSKLVAIIDHNLLVLVTL
jgi:hypothetical protein